MAQKDHLRAGGHDWPRELRPNDLNQMVLVAGVEAGSNVVEHKKFRSPAVKLRGSQINGCRESVAKTFGKESLR